MAKELVLVTGGSGYIASNIILQLLEQGYAVRTTVRSLDKIDRVKKIITAGALISLMIFLLLKRIYLAKRTGIKRWKVSLMSFILLLQHQS